MKKAGFEAHPCEPHFPDEWCFRSYPGENWDKEQEYLEQLQKGMSGVQTTASGKKAHKIISALKAENVIK